jgi:hypothetical protein
MERRQICEESAAILGGRRGSVDAEKLDALSPAGALDGTPRGAMSHIDNFPRCQAGRAQLSRRPGIADARRKLQGSTTKDGKRLHITGEFNRVGDTTDRIEWRTETNDGPRAVVWTRAAGMKIGRNET